MDWIYLSKDRGLVAGSCEHGSELSSSIKGGEFFLPSERLTVRRAFFELRLTWALLTKHQRYISTFYTMN
jgi:hypothetical protein